MSNSGIYWSLISEIIYYLIYPLLLSLRHRFEWKPIIAGAFMVAIMVILTNPYAGNYPSYGSQLNWVVGLPCWLLGCLLAEQADGIDPVGIAHLWLIRFAALGSSIVAVLLRWNVPHVSIGFPWTLTAFSLVAFFWLAVELRNFKSHEPPVLLERAGVWSYSIYLTHPVGFFLAGFVVDSVHAPPVVGLWIWPAPKVCTKSKVSLGHF